MNDVEQFAPPIQVAAPTPIHLSMASSNLSHQEEEQLESSTTRPVLSLIWNHVGEVVDGHEETRYERDRGLSTSIKRRDRGLWLLHGAFIRQEGWSSLNGELIEFQLSNSLSLEPGYALVKRMWDVVASLIMLGSLSPLLLLISILIRIESPGPAFFRQRRIGKDGAEFLLWKFRSMHTGAPKYAPSPTSNLDSRLTRIGRLLRRISLDELPQLVNVLAGEMSLVGPRPEMPFIVDSYTSFERRRLAVKPGITGLWQVSPARAFPIHENLQYDLHYIRNQNLFLDFFILLRTVTAVIRGAGAV
jgi:lipopolysaccharide/colanic/teichoic acid biosynthesis glycosyltransferase